MNFEYGMEYIEKLRIHELRDFARKMGISRPTTMKKEELITKLNELLENKDVVIDTESGKFVRNSEPIDFYSLLVSDKKGLIKGLFDGDADDEYNTMIDDDNQKTNSVPYNSVVMTNETKRYDDYDIYNPQKNFIGLSFNVSQIRAAYSSDIDLFEGYLVVEEKGYGVIRANSYLSSSKDVCITKALIDKYKLKTGDKIKGRVKYIIENQPQVMFEIVSIDSNPKKYKQLFDDFEFNGIGEKFNFKKYNLDIYRGQRIYINSLKLANCVDLCNDFLKNNNNTKVKFLNIKAKPEENYGSTDLLEMINCTFNISEKDIVNCVDLVVERIKREFENNKSNVLVIYNFSELINIYNAASVGAYDNSKVDINAMNKLFNILYIAKNYSEKLNITIICVDNTSETNEIIKQQFLSLFHNNIKEVNLSKPIK